MPGLDSGQRLPGEDQVPRQGGFQARSRRSKPGASGGGGGGGGCCGLPCFAHDSKLSRAPLPQGGSQAGVAEARGGVGEGAPGPGQAHGRGEERTHAREG